jgi:pantoate kinase
LDEVCVEVPLNVSGVWQPVRREEPELSGSVGISLVVGPPLTVRAWKGEGLTLNGIRVDFPNLKFLSSLGSLELHASSPVPLGYGYGLSGALSLGYALAAVELFHVERGRALKVAHVSDVLTGNGLGDVLSQTVGGGVVHRIRPGAPGIGMAERVDVQWRAVYSLPLQRLPTSSIVEGSPGATELISIFLRERTLESFFRVAAQFNGSMGFPAPRANSFRKKGLVMFLDEGPEGSIQHQPHGGARIC